MSAIVLFFLTDHGFAAMCGGLPVHPTQGVTGNVWPGDDVITAGSAMGRRRPGRADGTGAGSALLQCDPLRQHDQRADTADHVVAAHQPERIAGAHTQRPEHIVAAQPADNRVFAAMCGSTAQWPDTAIRPDADAP